MDSKNMDLMQKNPYSIRNFEYDMDGDVYVNKEGETYSSSEFERLQKEYEEMQQEKKEQESAGMYVHTELDDTIYDTRSEEELAKLAANENQLKLRKAVRKDISEVNIKRDNVHSAGGAAVPEPKYIGWDQAFTVRQKDDSEKMADIRSALENYHKVKGSIYEAEALKKLITSCNTYTWMKIPFLKFGKAKTRLNEVKALRARAIRKLQEQAPYYKGAALKDDGEKTVEKTVEKNESDDDSMIYEGEDSYEQKLFIRSSVGTKFVGGLAAVFGTLILTPFKIAAYPLKAMAYGVDKLYRYAEKKYDVQDTRRELDMSIKSWGPGYYLGGALKKIYASRGKSAKDIFYTPSMSRKIRELSEKESASLYDVSDETNELEAGMDYAQDMLEYKKKLSAEYKKANPDPKKIKSITDEIDTLRRYVDDYLKENPDADLGLDLHVKTDGELRLLKRAYDDRLEIKEIEKRDVLTRQEILEKTKTEEGRAEFNDQMRRIAMDNTYVRIKCDDMDLEKRDGKYDEKKLLKLLDEFEAFDIKKVTFSNHVDMLRDYEKNMNYFEQSRAAHYQLMRGLNRGIKIDDERLIRLRAKFTAMFEMQDYLAQLNHLVVNGELDLSADPEEIREKVTEGVKRRTVDRYPATLGNNEAFAASCEKAIRKQYRNRKNIIKRMHSLLVRSGEDEKIPAQLLKQKMDAYERNEVVYDYFHRKELRFFQENSVDMINTFNEENGTKIDAVGDRLHGTFLWGKNNEERIGLTRMTHQTGYGKLEYVKAMLKDMKSVDLKEYNHKDFAKFFDDFDRKCRTLVLCTNASDLAKVVKSGLQEIRDEENKERIARGEDPLDGPLELPDMFKEMGYANLEEFTIDMEVTQDVGNMIQGKFDAICQTVSHGYLSYFSLKELTSLDAYMSHDMLESFEKVKKEKEAEGEDLDENGELQHDALFETAEYLSGQQSIYNFELPTRGLSEKEKKLNKQNEEAGNTDAIIRQQRMTWDVDVEDVYREEKQSHYLDRIKSSRTKQTPDQLTAESKKAVQVLADGEKRMVYRTDLLAKNGYVKNQQFRQIRAYVGALSYLCGDSEEKSLQRAKAFVEKPEKATSGQKQAMAKEIESAFKVLMDFDMRELNINSYLDIMDKSHEHAMMMVRFCFDAAALFDRYETLMKDEGTETAFNEEEYREVMARKEFLLQSHSVYIKLMELMAKPMHQRVDTVSLLGLQDKEYEDFCKEFIEKGPIDGESEPYDVFISNTEAFFNNLNIARKMLHDNMIYPGMNMEDVYKAKKDRILD